jgi:hypothetical protein
VGKEEDDVLDEEWDVDALSFLFSSLAWHGDVLKKGAQSFMLKIHETPRCGLYGQLDDPGRRGKLVPPR